VRPEAADDDGEEGEATVLDRCDNAIGCPHLLRPAAKVLLCVRYDCEISGKIMIDDDSLCVG
jgi:hypothetical protein